jgi:hypothetical protein
MHRIIAIALLASAWLLQGPSARADLQLSITQDPSSTADLNALTPGEQVTFDVTLSGLDVAGGQTIGTLGGTVTFDQSLLGTALSITAGGIVPDPTGFLNSFSNGNTPPPVKPTPHTPSCLPTRRRPSRVTACSSVSPSRLNKHPAPGASRLRRVP